MNRILFGIVAFVSPIIFPWWLVIAFWSFYSFRYRGYELIFFGILADSFVGHTDGIAAFYTSFAIGIILTIGFLKKRLFLTEKIEERF